MSESKRSDQEALAKRFAGMFASPVSVPEMRVLLPLAYDGPKNMYQLAKQRKCTYPAVHGAMKKLEKLGWVKVVKSGMSEKKHPMSVYGLTTEGLLWLFSNVPQSLYPSFFYDPSFGLKKIPRKKEIEELEKLKSKKDLLMHLFFGFDFDSVAKKNPALLPTVLNEWKRLKELESADELVWHFPGVAFETLKEYYLYSHARGFEGLRTGFSSLEKIFAYRLLYRYLERISGPPGIGGPYSAGVSELVMQKVVMTLTCSPELIDLAEQILKDLKTENGRRRDFIDNAEAVIADRRSHERAT